jgi:hypothetical protein
MSEASLLKTLVGFATAIMAFGIFFAQAPSPNHVPDLIIWSLPTALLLVAVVKAWKPCVGSNAALTWLFVSGGELLFCLYVLVDVVQHPHSL